MLKSLKIASDVAPAAIAPKGGPARVTPIGIWRFGDVAKRQIRDNAGRCAASTLLAPLSAISAARRASSRAGDSAPRLKTLGIVALIVAAGLVVLNVTATNAVSATMSLPEIVGMRGCLACPLILALALILGRQGPLTNLWRSAALQSVGFDALNAMMFLSALTLMSFASDVSAQQTVPLFIVIYVCFVLGERLKWRQIAAIVVGFTGALFVVKPSFESLGWGAVLAFGAAITLAANYRKAATIDPPILPLLVLLIAGLVLTLGLAWRCLPDGWTAPEMTVRFEDTRGGLDQAVRGVGRPMVVRLQLADGL